MAEVSQLLGWPHKNHFVHRPPCARPPMPPPTAMGFAISRGCTCLKVGCQPPERPLNWRAGLLGGTGSGAASSSSSSSSSSSLAGANPRPLPRPREADESPRTTARPAPVCTNSASSCESSSGSGSITSAAAGSVAAQEPLVARAPFGRVPLAGKLLSASWVLSKDFSPSSSSSSSSSA
eukprot:CAMPEP_0177390122 /NCGR_PEP_ID=MMETSP0368-20130122/52986_1 /TAXON_ID=447022 ORGANISM="Scrippsiella hangoei-like, Strain SHHI-4" /NCGR_SAMPLE_ID=MMETSP0368 /ASSEMBLY_ACC=CAM_ASM_000363 /LENGTH=178 /DNA_ID=CAMNT_0018855691 /DNA_START=247 /DNA_END=779 /DNA_ORIENTATION=+